ncbi:MAG: hypothetical protein AAFY45_03545 [Bacteroidota bacterium]
MRTLRVSLVLALLCNLFICSFAQAPSKKNATLEQIIQKFIFPYGLSSDNQFKLAAYAELKGQFSNMDQSLTLNFGDLGYFSFFSKNCLFRSGKGVYHLNKYDTGSPSIELINKKLSEMFEHIILLGNGNADSDHIDFVDKHLAKKNIEPFDKIFIRHILLKYGEYDPLLGQVNFNTETLPDKIFARDKDAKNQTWLKKYISPLKIRLDEKILRGYYINSGGTVFVENVDRKVFYATGEQYDDNVTAFKVFIQKLFVQSAQYIVQNEADRLKRMSEKKDGIVTEMVSYDSSIDKSKKYVPRGGRRITKAKAVKPLYDHKSWIPMMMGLLAKQKIDITDEDVLPYFIERNDFYLIYERLSIEDQKKVDNFVLGRQ